MLTPSQYAEKIGKPYPTVMAWLQRGLVRGAEKTDIGKMSVYLIPEDAPYVEPTIGRPKKAASSTTDIAAKAKPTKKGRRK